jgi:hypothetical protein
MRCRSVSVAAILVQVLALDAAAQPPGPTIHRVTLQADSGLLTIEGRGLGPDLLVTIDGQPVTTLPGASDAVMQVPAPASVLTTAGTYRLTVGARDGRTGDGFVVASAGASPGVPVGRDIAERRDARAAAGAVETAGKTAPTRGPDARSGAARPDTVAPAAIIEDTGSPFRTAIGHQALIANTTGPTNTAAGFQALRFNTTGASNTAIGHQVLWSNSTGGGNTGVGVEALEDNTTGGRNTAAGLQSLWSNTTGNSNTAIGAGALAANTIGSSNVAIGDGAMLDADSSNNTAVGVSALSSVTTGTFNTALGRFAGFGITTGMHNVYLGALTLGSGAESHTIRLGVPYSAAGPLGQNATYIAGIRGTTVTGGEGVYVDADGRLGSGPVVPAPDSVGSAQVIADSLTAADLAPASVGTAEIADGAVTAAKVAFTFAGLGANTFGGTQTIDAGNLVLQPSTTAKGNLIKGGLPFLSNPGFMNTFLGESAGSLTVTGATNTALGGDALRAVAGGDANVASGYGALYSNVGGSGNTASGMQALFFTTGSYNTAVGLNAGAANATGSHNVYLGADVGGSAADANTMRLGLPFNVTSGAGQNRTFIAGVAGTVLTTPAVQVFIDANGQLGTLVPPPIVGSVDGGVTAGAASPRPSRLEQEIAAQRALLAEQAALIADLRARLARLEAGVVRAPRR